MAAVIEQKRIVQGGAFLIEERTPEEIFTPEDFTEEHRMIAETTRQFIDNEVTPRIDELEKHDWQLARQLVAQAAEDRKSTRLNSSHGYISYAVFCLKKKKSKT